MSTSRVKQGPRCQRRASKRARNVHFEGCRGRSRLNRGQSMPISSFVDSTGRAFHTIYIYIYIYYLCEYIYIYLHAADHNLPHFPLPHRSLPRTRPFADGPMRGPASGFGYISFSRGPASEPEGEGDVRERLEPFAASVGPDSLHRLYTQVMKFRHKGHESQ